MNYDWRFTARIFMALYLRKIRHNFQKKKTTRNNRMASNYIILGKMFSEKQQTSIRYKATVDTPLKLL